MRASKAPTSRAPLYLALVVLAAFVAHAVSSHGDDTQAAAPPDEQPRFMLTPAQRMLSASHRSDSLGCLFDVLDMPYAWGWSALVRDFPDLQYSVGSVMRWLWVACLEAFFVPMESCAAALAPNATDAATFDCFRGTVYFALSQTGWSSHTYFAVNEGLSLAWKSLALPNDQPPSLHAFKLALIALLPLDVETEGTMLYFTLLNIDYAWSAHALDEGAPPPPQQVEEHGGGPHRQVARWLARHVYQRPRRWVLRKVGVGGRFEWRLASAGGQ